MINLKNDEIKQSQIDPIEQNRFPGLGIGLFLLAVGVLYFAEYFGWISKDFKWGLPTIAVVAGITYIVKAVAANRRR